MNLLRVIDTLVQKNPNPTSTSTSTSTSNFTSTSTFVLVDQDWYHAKGATCNSFLEAVYGESVWYICLQEHVRTFRCHLLADRCLYHMIVSNAVHGSPWFATYVDHSEEMYLSLVAGETISESIETSDIHFVIMGKIKLNLTNESSIHYGRQ